MQNIATFGELSSLEIMDNTGVTEIATYRF